MRERERRKGEEVDCYRDKETQLAVLETARAATYTTKPRTGILGS